MKVDEQDYPLVMVQVVGSSTDEEVQTYIERMEALIDRAYATGRRAVHVMDARKSVTNPANQRRMLGDWMKSRDQQNRETCGGFAFVFESALVRGLLTAVLWMHPLPAPHRVFGSIGEALLWAKEQIESAQPVSGLGRRRTG